MPFPPAGRTYFEASAVSAPERVRSLRGSCVAFAGKRAEPPWCPLPSLSFSFDPDPVLTAENPESSRLMASFREPVHYLGCLHDRLPLTLGRHPSPPSSMSAGSIVPCSRILRASSR